MAHASAVAVGSTLTAFARTLGSDAYAQQQQLGLTTISAPRGERAEQTGGELPLAELELSKDARYEPLGTLGVGGMGQVDAVWDRDLMRQLALKQPHIEGAKDGHTLRHFLWEARITAHLDHPNIIPVHDLGLDGAGRLYFTMKRVQGRSLAELITLLGAVDDSRLTMLECCHRGTPAGEEDPLVAEYGPYKKRLRVVVEVCQAIAYAHDRGVLHRDLKPANVMLGQFGEVLVMDWGLATPIPARADEALVGLLPETLREAPDTMLGTPRYMAPELLRGVGPSERSDVYALGVLLYELLALQLPHHATSVPELVMQITEGEVRPLAEVAPRLERPVIAVVERAMAHEPGQRYAEVADLILDLEAVLDGLSPVAEQASTLTRVRRYFLSRSNPDTAHLRLLDLDLTGAAGIAAGIAGTLFLVGGHGWLPLLPFVIGLAVFLVPMRSYWRVVRSGRRRFARERARERELQAQ